VVIHDRLIPPELLEQHRGQAGSRPDIDVGKRRDAPPCLGQGEINRLLVDRGATAGTWYG